MTAPLDGAMADLAADRALALVRAPMIPDAAALCRALRDGGLRCIELTLTTPDLTDHLRAASAVEGCRIGAGTVLTAAEAAAAIDAGAEFLVTPGLRAQVAEVAREREVPVVMGALTPSEVLAALDLGAAAVKIFPARLLGPRYLRDLCGPLPGARLIPSGGITGDNAADFLANGALAVSAGTGTVPPDAVARGDWPEITRRARDFTATLRGRAPRR